MAVDFSHLFGNPTLGSYSNGDPSAHGSSVLGDYSQYSHLLPMGQHNSFMPQAQGAVPSGGAGTGQAAPKGLGQIGGALGIASGLMGLFGSHGDNGASEYEQAAKENARSLTGLGDVLRGHGGEQWDYNRADTANARAATADYANYLKQDPYTDQREAADLQRSIGDTANIYARTRASLLADSSLRNAGGSVSSGTNSYLAGALGANANALGNTIGQASNNLAYQRIGARRDNLAALANLYSGQAQQDFNNGMGAYGQSAGDYQNAFADNNSLYNTALAKSQAQAGSQMNDLGQVVGGAAMFF